MESQKRPRFTTQTKRLTVYLTVDARSSVDALAIHRGIFAGAIVRAAVDAYLAKPSIKAELRRAHKALAKRAATPSADVAPTAAAPPTPPAAGSLNGEEDDMRAAG